MPEYRNPIPTVDIVIFMPGNNIVLVKRKNPPIGWALPGGFVDEGESFADAARREAKEETGLDVDLLCQLHTYSDPARDPRRHIVTTAYLADGRGTPKAADDAAEVLVVPEWRIPWQELVFDHKKIIQHAIAFHLDGKRVIEL